MKGKWEMHRLVVRITFRTSCSACVPGLHFCVQHSGSFLMLLFFPGCGGMILPPGVGLKNVPFGGLLTVKSEMKYINCTCLFQPF